MASIDKKNQALGDKKKFEIILKGYDRNKESHRKYFKGAKLGWAIKHGQNESLKALTKKGETGYIPNIILLKPDGTMESNDRAKVLAKLEKLVATPE